METWWANNNPFCKMFRTPVPSALRYRKCFLCQSVSRPSERVLTMWRKDKRRPLISYRPSLLTGGIGVLLMVEPRLWSCSTKYTQHTHASQCIHNDVIKLLDKKKADKTFFFNLCMSGNSKQTKVCAYVTLWKIPAKSFMWIGWFGGSSPQANSHVYICKTRIEEN